MTRLLLAVGVAAAGYALYRLGGPDPSRWRETLPAEGRRIAAQARESLTAGRRAAARRERELEEELEAEMERARPS